MTFFFQVRIQNDVPLKLYKHTFLNLRSLKQLAIANSSSNLPDELFTRCDALEIIDLSGNKITSLPPKIFEESNKLEYLELSRNEIASLSSEVFSPLKQLKYLSLNRNFLEVLPDDLFSGLDNLTYVTIDDNLLNEISPNAFRRASGIKILSLKSNKLTFKNNLSSPFHTLIGLKYLYLNGNEINEMFYDWRWNLTELMELNLYGNHFTILHASDCQFQSKNVKVDLRHNLISTLILNGVSENETVSKDLQTIYKTLYKSLPQSILLGDNPLRCDCGLYNLTIRISGIKHVIGEPAFDVDNATCASPPHLKGELIKNLSPHDLKCDLPPELCYNTCSSCEIRPATNDLAYDCKTLPKTLQHPENFSLKFLTLRLRTAPENIDNLHLDLLNLSNIGIDEIPFSPSKTVKGIDLSNNKLTKIPMQFLESNISLYLSNNSFECDCWLTTQKASQIIKDLAHIRCGDKLLTSMDPSELCNNLRVTIVVGVSFLIFVLLVAIIVTVVFRNSQKILTFIIVKGLCPCCFVEEPDDKEYDVFVSYAHKDREYLEQLMPKLENEFGLKTCVHYRDWYVGDFIPDQINRSVETSRKTIILLSNNFLDSGYVNMEFRAAHNVTLREGKSKIILILLEDVTKHEKLCDALKLHLKMNTFLKWDDARFSERLQRALPLRDNKKFVWPKML